ncbi:hypothetical protein HSX11_11725 [Oxalobacteraceae bacterium]|nr:hypothetical protein [Oxalobacteraceae bacterium]
MKRLPLIFTFAAVVALSASLAYWGLQWFKPAERPIAPPPVVLAPEPNMDAARGLFGGEIAVATASNYQLKGVVSAANGQGSAAIISIDGKPAEAFGVGRDVAPGVTVKEVQPKHVIISEGGVLKRLELVNDASRNDSGISVPAPAQAQNNAQPPSNLTPPASAPMAPPSAPAPSGALSNTAPPPPPPPVPERGHAAMPSKMSVQQTTVTPAPERNN